MAGAALCTPASTNTFGYDGRADSAHLCTQTVENNVRKVSNSKLSI